MNPLEGLFPSPDPATALLPGETAPDSLDLTHRGCRRCAEDHGPYLRPESCPRCRHHSWGFRRVLAARAYDGGLRRVLTRLKHGAPGADPRLMASWLLPLLQEETFDVLVPVPNTIWRQLKRGVNSAEWIAQQLSAQSGVPCQRALSRHGWRRPQRQLSAEERLSMSEKHFRLTGNVSGQRVALIDDVLTTGATAEACTRRLIAGGAADVCVVVVARSLEGRYNSSHS